MEEQVPHVGLRAQRTPPPGTRPAALREPGLQLVVEHAARPCCSGPPPLPALGGDCSLTTSLCSSSLHTLLEREQKALALKEEEELEAALASKEQRLMVEIQRFARTWDRTSRLSPVEAVAATWCEAKTALMQREKRKKKKKKKKKKKEEEDEEVTLAPVWVPGQLLLMTPLRFSLALFAGRCWVLPEEYCGFLGDDFWFILVFSFDWFDSGYMFGVAWCISTAPASGSRLFDAGFA